MIIPPVVVALNAVTYTEINIEEHLELRDVAVYTEDLSAFTIATTAAGANAAVIPGGLSASFKNVETHGPLMYVKAFAGTPNLVVLAGKVS